MKLKWDSAAFYTIRPKTYKVYSIFTDIPQKISIDSYTSL